MLNCVIIDDEPLAIQLLDDFVRRIPYLHLIGKYEDPLSSLAVMEHQKTDLLFLDIKMPDISGIEFYKSLSHKPQVIFTTAYSEFAINGFELKAVDYLLKPISFEKFITACNRVRDIIALKESRKDSRTKEYFFINVAHRMQKVFYDDILYLEGYKDYTKLHLKSVSNPLLILHNLKYFEDLLQSHDFIRIHRSYIVSLEKLDTISRKSVSIAATILPVSDNYRDAFLGVVGHYVK